MIKDLFRFFGFPHINPPLEKRDNVTNNTNPKDNGKGSYNIYKCINKGNIIKALWNKKATYKQQYKGEKITNSKYFSEFHPFHIGNMINLIYKTYYYEEAQCQ